MNEANALAHRTAELLRSSAVADQIGRVKVGLLRSAAWWFRIAVLVLVAVAGLLLAYAIYGPKAPAVAGEPVAAAVGAGAAAPSAMNAPQATGSPWTALTPPPLRPNHPVGGDP